MTRYVKVNNELGKWEKREITNEIIGSNHTKELAEDTSYEKESSRKSTRPTGQLKHLIWAGNLYGVAKTLFY